MSLYSLKTAGGGAGAQAPWSAVLALAEAGDNLARLAALYDKRPETLLSGTTLELPTTLDGPLHVARFGDLTLNNAVITARNRCRGLFVLCDSLTVTGAASVIHMDGKGSTATDWTDYDLSIPATVSLTSELVAQRDVLAAVRKSGHYIGDPLFLAGLAPLVQASLAHGANLIVDKTTGLGTGGAGSSLTAYGSCSLNAAAGGAGARGPGGGAGGSAYYKSGGNGSKARSWRGGFGGYSSGGENVVGDTYRCGYPAGVLIVAVLKTLTVGPGLTCRANAAYWSGTTYGGAGGSGGGRVLLLTPPTVSGTPTLQAAGDGGYAAICTEKTGGAGAATQSTLAAWGL